MKTTSPTDVIRLSTAAEFVKEQDTATLLALLLPGLDALEQQALTEHCEFSHAAVLIFPVSSDDLGAQLACCGLDTQMTAQPSVIVRDRLADRHGRRAAELDVQILRPRVHGPKGEPRSVEVFALTVPLGSELEPIAEHERNRQHEEHLAFDVKHPDPLVLRGMLALFAKHSATPDGGGYNLHEDGTVFYFTTPAGSKAEFRRVELYAPGDHRDVLAAHQHQDRTAQTAKTLLRLMTGAWTTQALTAFAEQRVADAMDTSEGTTPETLAKAVDCQPQALARLLRYLAMLNVVAEDRNGFRLTELGTLLRDAPDSLRSLALLYGGPFYRSFEGLGHTLRTGQAAFDHIFGESHFEYFARNPELARLFDQSMAASSPLFEPLTAHPVVTSAGRAPTPRTVVDVAGGNGELLRRILTAHPNLRGILLERPHVIEAARLSLRNAGCDARCTYQAGDFADIPPDGDIYILSRVLHDWDDDRCGEILRHCALAMPVQADLLIIERILPTDNAPSLATAWDLHMMCNVGGLERRADHYARLLANANLSLLDCAPLPLDGSVLHARKSPPEYINR